MKTFLITLLVINGIVYHGFSQGSNDALIKSREQVLDIYLDCASCDLAYFKTHFTSVNYVADRTDADVYILVTTLATGSGGTEYTIQLNGMNRFRMQKDTVIFSVPVDATLEIRRARMLEYTRLSLVPFLLKTMAGEKLTLYIDEEAEIENGIRKQDPWRSWNFEVGAGGEIFSQKTSKSYGIRGRLYITRITPEIKLESSNRIELNESKLRLYDGDSLIYSSFSSQKYLSSSNLFVKSLGNHCGLGGKAVIRRSDYSNLDLQLIVGPMVEFNLFSYADASNKQFRFLYGVTYEYSDYMDLTILGKLTEHRFTHDLNIMFSYIDKWGMVDATLYGSSYLNDWSQFSLGANAMVDINLGRGVSFSISGGFSYIQNQIGLKQGAASMEEFLLNQREFETDINYTISVGFSFRFGSRFNNTVNPRFW